MHDHLTASVIRVGNGRGFVIEGKPGERLVITAAHCLPTFPPCASMSHTYERTYRALLSKIGETPATWAECLFVDPIGDIAILGTPDTQDLSDEAEVYDALVAGCSALPIADAANKSDAWLLSLDGRWCKCVVTLRGGPFWIDDAADGIWGGMSGSPILNNDGATLGVVVTGGGIVGSEKYTNGGPNPRLVHNLPRWALPARRA